MAWKRDWHVEVTCEKCGTKKEAYVTCRQDEVGHYTWRLSYCDKCEEWMKAEEIVTAIPKIRPTPRALDGRVRRGKKAKVINPPASNA